MIDLATLGLTLAASIAIGTGLGIWTDRMFGTRGILVVVGAMLGIAAGFQQLWKSAMRAVRAEEAEVRRQKETKGEQHGNGDGPRGSNS